MSEYVPPDLTMFGEEHVARYLETDGEIGYEWNGAPCLLLTTTGHKSGEPRTVPLIFGPDGDAASSSRRRAARRSTRYWYRNLAANPDGAGAGEGRHVHRDRAHRRGRGARPLLGDRHRRCGPTTTST